MSLCVHCPTCLAAQMRFKTALVLDANDTKGPASLDYFLQELSMSFDIWLCGKDVPTRPFTALKLVEFPP